MSHDSVGPIDFTPDSLPVATFYPSVIEVFSRVFRADTQLDCVSLPALSAAVTDAFSYVSRMHRIFVNSSVPILLRIIAYA